MPAADVHVDPGPNARSDDEQELVALRDSIARPRILQPLVVHARDEGGVWLVAGHRRLAAAKAAGLEKVPAVTVAGERLELTAVENLQPVPLRPLEETRAFQALIDAGHSPRGVAKALGVATRRVTERPAILELTDAGRRAASPPPGCRGGPAGLARAGQVRGRAPQRGLDRRLAPSAVRSSSCGPASPTCAYPGRRLPAVRSHVPHSNRARS